MSDSLIRFRCSRCTRPLSVPSSQIGKQIYCPACYTRLTVPKENAKAIDDVDPSKLYNVDAIPIDVRDAPERFEFYSFDCPVCFSKLAVHKEDVGKEVECPDCGRKSVVPSEILNQSIPIKAAPKESGIRFVIPSFVKTKVDPRIDKNSYYGIETNDSPAPLIDANGNPIDDRDNRPKFRSVVRDGRFAVYCPLCATMQYVSVDLVGTKIRCPECEREFPVYPPNELNPKPLNEGTFSFEGGTVYGIAGEEKVVLAPQGNSLLSESSLNSDSIEKKRATDSTAEIPDENPSNRKAASLKQSNEKQSNAEQSIERRSRSTETSPNPNGATNPNESPNPNAPPNPNGSPNPNESPKPNESPRQYYNPDSDPNLVSVVCKLCGTLMYAPRSEIGRTKRCPDCLTETTIQDKTDEQKIVEERILPKSTGGYSVRKAEPPTVKSFLDESYLLRQVKTPLEKLMDEQRNRQRSKSERRSSPPDSATSSPLDSASPPPVVSATSPPVASEPPKKSLPPSVLAAFHSNDSPSKPNDSRSNASPPTDLKSSASPSKPPVSKSPDSTIPKKRRQPERSRRSNAGFVEGIQSKRQGNSVLLTTARPPRFPMLDGVFRPLANFELWMRSIVPFSLLVVVNFAIATVFLPMLASRTDRFDFSYFCVSLFDVGLMTRYLILPTLFFTGLFFAAWVKQVGVLFMTIFAVLAGGGTRLGEWPEEDFVGGLATGGRLFLIILLAGLPFEALGDLAFPRQGDRIVLTTLFGCLTFFPIFFLSSLQTDFLFVPLTGSIAKSFKRRFVSWLGFYAWTFLLIGLPSSVVLGFCSGAPLWIFLTLAASIYPTLYAALLGRLAWVVEDSIRNADLD